MLCVIRSIALVATSLGCALACTPASATLYKFHIKGQVSYSDHDAFPDVPVGTKVHGSYVYDTDAEPVYSSHGDGYDSATYSFRRGYPLKLWFGDHTIRSIDYVFYDIMDGTVHSYPDRYGIGTGDTGIKVDGVPCTVSTCYVALTMYTRPQSSDVLTSIDLPPSIDVRQFDAERYGYVRTHVDNSPTLEFTIDKITSRPCRIGSDPSTACDD